jgi:hypothetical protein
MRVMVRAYKEGKLLWEKEQTIAESEIVTLGEHHASEMAAGRIGMVEIEFLDDPNPNERFFRIGLEPHGMVWPVEVDLTLVRKRRLQ